MQDTLKSMSEHLEKQGLDRYLKKDVLKTRNKWVSQVSKRHLF
jgi:hypothetical protein